MENKLVEEQEKRCLRTSERYGFENHDICFM